jgi:hypothetical protein
MRRILGIVLATLALAACAEQPLSPLAPVPAYAPPPPPPPPQSYDGYRDSDFAWSTAVGTGKVVGVLAYKGDEPHYGCQTVVLAPETPWSRERMRALYLSTTSADVPSQDVKARTPPEHAAQYGRFVRQAPCDANGRFSFSGLPNGAWYVITVAAPAGNGVRIAVMRRIETHGDTMRVVLR